MGDRSGRLGPAGFPHAGRWHALEDALIVLIALHSVAVGCALLLATRWGLAFGGFEAGPGLFFPRQAGVFHLVVAAGYLLEWKRYGGVSFLLTAKSAAVLFLVAMTAVDGGPWPLPLSAAGDGLMAAAVALAHRASRR